MTVTILISIGTRPEAIKMAPVVHALQREDWLRLRILVTAQHRQLLDQCLGFFDIAADIDLDTMREDQNLAELTSRMLNAVHGVLAEEQPDFVLAQGDTTTVMAAALASFYRRIPFIHVEAGLRTGSLTAPWPEELNRRICGIVADLHCAPTRRAKENLLAEGVDPATVRVTGNTVVDALLWTVQTLRQEGCNYARKFGIEAGQPVVLITGHRRENFGDALERICLAIANLSDQFRHVQFVYPVHLNPNVQGPVHRLLGNRKNIRLGPPAPYREFVWLMDRAKLILTDSGGVQEEALSLGKPVLVMRETTERPEAVEAGVAELVGSSTDAIQQAASRLLLDDENASRRIQANPYGDGRAAQRIVDWMIQRPWQQRCDDGRRRRVA